ncbi:MAG: site-specific integrase [Clostridium sp.]|nr:site-specific integrase [Clostridium sp.]
MVSVKLKLGAITRLEEQGMIYYLLVRNQEKIQIKSGYAVTIGEWDKRSFRINISGARDRDHRNRLTRLQDRIDRDVKRLCRIIYEMETTHADCYRLDEVVAVFARQKSGQSLFGYMESLVQSLNGMGRHRTSETYAATLKSFSSFTRGEDVLIEEMDAGLMQRYEAFLRGRSLTKNTVSFYMRILRAVYNRAVEQCLVEPGNPFKHVYTGIDKTVKRAIPLDAIRRIKALDLSCLPSAAFARDMFLMSFYLRGMSFIDMFYLRKSDLRHGHVTYRRRKTGQQLTIAWTPPMQAILDKYPVPPSGYLLPFPRTLQATERSLYRNTSYRINYNLKKVAALADIPIPLTLYVARHSWATAARSKGIPLRIISEGMGHDSEHTTQIYLASLDTAEVDQANELIMEGL